MNPSKCFLLVVSFKLDPHRFSLKKTTSRSVFSLKCSPVINTMYLFVKQLLKELEDLIAAGIAEMDTR